MDGKTRVHVVRAAGRCRCSEFDSAGADPPYLKWYLALLAVAAAVDSVFESGE